MVGKGKPGGWAEEVLHNKSGRCGRDSGRDSAVAPPAHTTSLLPELWDQEAFAHGHGTVHGHGTAHGHGQSMGVMALGARASVGQGTYDLVQVMCRPVHAGPTSGFPQKRATTGLLGQKGRSGPASTPLLVLDVASHSAHESSKPRLARCTTASQTRDSLSITESARLLVYFISFHGNDRHPHH